MSIVLLGLLMWKMFVLDFPPLGETMRTVTEAGRRAAIDQALRGE